MNLKKLEQTGALQTIAYLFNVKKASKTDIGKSIEATFDTLNKKTLPYLEELNLISHIELTEFPYTHLYRLTEKGLKLALCLSQING